MWFKRDLRISDNHALLEATTAQEPLICIYNLDSERILRDDVDGIHIKWELDCLSLLKIDLAAHILNENFLTFRLHMH